MMRFPPNIFKFDKNSYLCRSQIIERNRHMKHQTL
jgi:hypothetical protein